MSKPKTYRFDVSLSFAGANRAYVRRVADILRNMGVRVFFDEYSKADMWGKDLYTHLQDFYQNAARYCVLFLSKQYAKNVWTNHERQSAQARAIRQNSEYILPARFDNTQIPGLAHTIGYISLRKMSPSGLAKLIQEKLGNKQRHAYFPPSPDILFKKMGARSKLARHVVSSRAFDFFESLERMNDEERLVVFAIFHYACPSGPRRNVHVNLDFLRRVMGFPQAKIIRIVDGIASLGFIYRLKTQHHDATNHKSEVLFLEWADNRVDDDVLGNATAEAEAMLSVASEDFCDKHALEMLMRLDFSQLSSATRRKDLH